jgi:hypothetical protein
VGGGEAAVSQQRERSYRAGFSEGLSARNGFMSVLTGRSGTVSGIRPHGWLKG